MVGGAFLSIIWRIFVWTLSGCCCWRFIECIDWCGISCSWPLVVPGVHKCIIFMDSKTVVGYADDATLVRVVPKPSDSTSVTDSFNADLAVISNWCMRWGMKLNAGKTKVTSVSRSRTLDPHFSDLLVKRVQLESVC